MIEKQKFKINESYVPVKRMKELDPLKVTKIAEGILEGENILPIRVRSGNNRYVLIKGLHTLEALKALGEEEIEGYLTRAQLH